MGTIIREDNEKFTELEVNDVVGDRSELWT